MDHLQVSAIRKKLGLNQVQFAQLFGVHQMTVSRWERGTLAPTFYQAAMLNEFNVAADRKAEEVRDQLGQILVGAGIVAAIYFLLTAAKGGK